MVNTTEAAEQALRKLLGNIRSGTNNTNHTNALKEFKNAVLAYNNAKTKAAAAAAKVITKPNAENIGIFAKAYKALGAAARKAIKYSLKLRSKGDPSAQANAHVKALKSIKNENVNTNATFNSTVSRLKKSYTTELWLGVVNRAGLTSKQNKILNALQDPSWTARQVSAPDNLSSPSRGARPPSSQTIIGPGTSPVLTRGMALSHLGASPASGVPVPRLPPHPANVKMHISKYLRIKNTQSRSQLEQYLKNPALNNVTRSEITEALSRGVDPLSPMQKN
jgi:hypothetical protein